MVNGYWQNIVGGGGGSQVNGKIKGKKEHCKKLLVHGYSSMHLSSNGGTQVLLRTREA